MTIAPISVVIPAFNAEQFIGDAIRSVQAQTMSVAEIIVVDNNCTDQTAEIAQKMGAIVIKQPKVGPSAARNRGIAISKQSWIAFLDADDLWDKQKINYQWEIIKACPKASVISSGFYVFDDKWRSDFFEKSTDGRSEEIDFEKDFKFISKVKINDFLQAALLPSSVILNRNVFSTVGLFDEKFLYHQDAEYFSRLLAQSSLAIVDKPLTYYRQHQNNRSHEIDQKMEAMLLIIEKMARFPENYLPGAKEHYLNSLKQAFLRKNRRLASEMKEQLL